MPTSLGNEKQTDQNREESRIIWVFALTTFFVLAVAAFVGIIF
jgi:Co/Zn/Cd efflux system component